MIEFRNVSVRYHEGVTALSNINLRILTGEFLFIVGPSGAGKSTFLRLLYGENSPTEGSVHVFKTEINRLHPRDIPYLRRKVGVVFQDFGLLPDKTAYENVAFALRVIGRGRKAIRQIVPHTLELVGMSHRPDAFPHQLSGGEQQRIAIARALVNNPPLLLADEPTGNLDPDTSQGLMELLKYIHEQGTTVIVATHDAAVVDKMQQRVVAFAQGKIVRDEQQGSYRDNSFDTEVINSREGEGR